MTSDETATATSTRTRKTRPGSGPNTHGSDGERLYAASAARRRDTRSAAGNYPVRAKRTDSRASRVRVDVGGATAGAVFVWAQKAMKTYQALHAEHGSAAQAFICACCGTTDPNLAHVRACLSGCLEKPIKLVEADCDVEVEAIDGDGVVLCVGCICEIAREAIQVRFDFAWDDKQTNRSEA